MLKKIVTKMLEKRAAKLLQKNKPKVVAVVGSAGKTSTKLAIAAVLEEKYRVLTHYSNYNTPIGLPMSLFDLHIPPKVHSIAAWIGVFSEISKKLREPYPYDVVVVELGADHPGDIDYFKSYIKPDIAVVTAVAEEHMEFFGNLEAVAKEELGVASFANLTLINRDDVSAEYAKFVPDGINIDTFGTSGIAEYHFLSDSYKPGEGFSGTFVSPEFKEQKVTLHVVGEHNIRGVVAAGAVGIKMGLSAEQVIAGMQKVVPVFGRMNLLRGLDETIIIDDSYNASPISTIAALQTLYVFPAKQRIAILGSMNELGQFSKEAHRRVGEACDSALLDWVITIGQDAQKYLAPVAEARGCRVRCFVSPYEAGACVHQLMQPGAVILVKGSQNRVFAEEAIKILLHSTDDEEKLVRQSPDWLEIKEKQFGKFSKPVDDD